MPKQAVLALAVLAGPTLAQDRTDNLVGQYGDWSVYTERDPVECFASTLAMTGPMPGASGAPFLLVAIWPDRGGLPEFSFTTEGPALAGTLQLRLDNGVSWRLVPEGVWAWPAGAGDDAAIAALLPDAAAVTVSGELAGGKGFNARFSLNGYAEALEAATRLCSSAKPAA